MAEKFYLSIQTDWWGAFTIVILMMIHLPTHLLYFYYNRIFDNSRQLTELEISAQIKAFTTSFSPEVSYFTNAMLSSKRKELKKKKKNFDSCF